MVYNMKIDFLLATLTMETDRNIAALIASFMATEHVKHKQFLWALFMPDEKSLPKLSENDVSQKYVEKHMIRNDCWRDLDYMNDISKDIGLDYWFEEHAFKCDDDSEIEDMDTKDENEEVEVSEVYVNEVNDDDEQLKAGLRFRRHYTYCEIPILQEFVKWYYYQSDENSLMEKLCPNSDKEKKNKYKSAYIKTLHIYAEASKKITKINADLFASCVEKLKNKLLDNFNTYDSLASEYDKYINN